jgi:uncharacterized protein
MNDKIIILYHANCYDGFGAAWVAWHKFGDGATYLAANYGPEAPEFPLGSDLYILDFSYPPEVLAEYGDKMRKVVVLDHHKTAEENLSEFSHPNVEVIFDMEKSGAQLALEYFNPQMTANQKQLIAHIQDRDLWKFNIKGSKEVHKALVSYPMNFELWDTFKVDGLYAEGITCERIYSQLVDNICENSWIGCISGYHVPVVNTSIAWSEVGAYLAGTKYEAYDFVASFTVFSDNIMFSLRSIGNFDVSSIAKRWGGGGHKNAAGFKLTGNDRYEKLKSILKGLDKLTP